MKTESVKKKLFRRNRWRRGQGSYWHHVATWRFGEYPGYMKPWVFKMMLELRSKGFSTTMDKDPVAQEIVQRHVKAMLSK